MSLSPNMRGAALMSGSMAAFTLNDACIKLVAGDLPLMQIVLLRGIFTTLMMLALAWAMGLRSLALPRRDRFWVGVRTFAEVTSMWAFLTALLYMPLANLAAVLAALPLTVSLSGALFLGEPVGWRRLSAILVGFCGVMLIVQPGGAGFNSYSLLALLAVALVTLRDIATRKFSAETPSMAVAVLTAAAVGIFGGVMSLGQPWVAVTSQGWWLIGGASVFIIGGYVFAIMVMRVGEIGFVAPFRYTSLIWALALGWMVFGDWPDRLTLAGAVIVAATGIFTLYRERMALRTRGAAHG